MTSDFKNVFTLHMLALQILISTVVGIKFTIEKTIFFCQWKHNWGRDQQETKFRNGGKHVYCEEKTRFVGGGNHFYFQEKIEVWSGEGGNSVYGWMKPACFKLAPLGNQVYSGTPAEDSSTQMQDTKLCNSSFLTKSNRSFGNLKAGRWNFIQV